MKAEILKMVGSKQSIPKLSRNLGISERIIYRWQYKSKPTSKEAVEVDSLNLMNPGRVPPIELG